jgi:hypothetical protein
MEQRFRSVAWLTPIGSVGTPAGDRALAAMGGARVIVAPAPDTDHAGPHLHLHRDSGVPVFNGEPYPRRGLELR